MRGGISEIELARSARVLLRYEARLRRALERNQIEHEKAIAAYREAQRKRFENAAFSEAFDQVLARYPVVNEYLSK